MTTNKANGKIYIGSDTKNSGFGDPSYLGSGILISKAVDKYGFENFSKEVLCTCITLEDLKEAESFYIRKYSSFKRDIGYNISNGYWGGDTLSEHPDLESIKEKIKIKSLEYSKKISQKAKEFYAKESQDEKQKRIDKISISMRSSDKSLYSDPKYLQSLSNGIKNSTKFQKYNEKRKGAKREKYSINKEFLKSKRISLIEEIENGKMKSLLNDLLEKDHSTFSCHLQVYLYLEGRKEIEGLQEFFCFLDDRIYSENLTLREASHEYKRLGLDKCKLGKSSTVIKSIYNFQEYGSYPSRIINISRKFVF